MPEEDRQDSITSLAAVFFGEQLLRLMITEQRRGPGSGGPRELYCMGRTGHRGSEPKVGKNLRKSGTTWSWKCQKMFNTNRPILKIDFG